jgi:hypothetical protein
MAAESHCIIVKDEKVNDQIPDVNGPSIISNPENGEAIYGDSISFTVEAEGTDLTYQWQYSKDGENWVDSTVSGYATNSISVVAKPANNELKYRCKVKSGEDEVYSDSAVISSIPIISEQPESTSAKSRDMFQFTVGTRGSDVTYQWQYSKDGICWYNSTADCRNTNTYEHKAIFARHDLKYRCRVWHGDVTEVSSVVTLTVGPKVFRHPEDESTDYGHTVFFNVRCDVDKDDVTYQWQYSADGIAWEPCSYPYRRYDTDLLIAVLDRNKDGYMYRCEVTCHGISDYSNPAILQRKRVIYQQPKDVEISHDRESVDFVCGYRGNNLESVYWEWSTDGVHWKRSAGSRPRRGYLRLPLSETNFEAARKGIKYRCVIKYGDETLISETAGFIIVDE